MRIVRRSTRGYMHQLAYCVLQPALAVPVWELITAFSIPIKPVAIHGERTDKGTD